MTTCGEAARATDPRTRADHEHVPRARARADREVVLTTRLALATQCGAPSEDVADAAVLVDARADVVGATLGELVGQVGVGEELAAHGDEVGLAGGEGGFGFVRLHAAERDNGHFDRGRDLAYSVSDPGAPTS